MKLIVSRALSMIHPGWTTLDAWLPTYLEIMEARPIKLKTKQMRRGIAERISAALGDRRLSRIKPVHISRLIRGIWESGEQSTSQRVLSEARSIFNEAINAGLIKANPAASVRALSYHVARSRLSLETWLKMLEVADRHPQRWVAPMLRLALVTGQRRGDLRKMAFSDVWDGLLHVEQEKTGVRVAIPVALRLDAVGLSIAEIIEQCRLYAKSGRTLLQATTGKALDATSLSKRFSEVLFTALGGHWSRPGQPPSLHECRSLAERLYRKQGVDTKTLLGHKKQRMTDKYNDPRGLDADQWKILRLE